MTRLKNRVAQVAGLTLYLQPTQDLTIDAESGPTQYRVSLEGADNATVIEWARKLVAQMARQKQLRNVTTDAGALGAAAVVHIDRDTASRLGDHRVAASTTRSTAPSASASSRPSSPRPTSTA